MLQPSFALGNDFPQFGNVFSLFYKYLFLDKCCFLHEVFNCAIVKLNPEVMQTRNLGVTLKIIVMRSMKRDLKSAKLILQKSEKTGFRSK